MYYFVNKEKYCQICTYPVWFYFTVLVYIHRSNGIDRCLYKSHGIILVFCEQWKMISDLNAAWENVWFCFIKTWKYHNLCHKTLKSWF